MNKPIKVRPYLRKKLKKVNIRGVEYDLKDLFYNKFTREFILKKDAIKSYIDWKTALALGDDILYEVYENKNITEKEKDELVSKILDNAEIKIREAYEKMYKHKPKNDRINVIVNLKTGEVRNELTRQRKPIYSYVKEDEFLYYIVNPWDVLAKGNLKKAKEFIKERKLSPYSLYHFEKVGKSFY